MATALRSHAGDDAWHPNAQFHQTEVPVAISEQLRLARVSQRRSWA